MLLHHHHHHHHPHTEAVMKAAAVGNICFCHHNTELCWTWRCAGRRGALKRYNRSDTQPFRHTTARAHNRSDTQPFRHTTVQTHNRSDTQPFRHTTAQTHNRSDTQPFRHTTVRAHNRSDTQPLGHTTGKQGGEDILPEREEPLDSHTPHLSRLRATLSQHHLATILLAREPSRIEMLWEP